jgi:hypothetical protein
MPDVRVRDVLGAVFDGCDGLLELRAKSPADDMRTDFMASNDVQAIAAFVAAHQNDDVWFGVASRRDGSSGALANCLHLGCLFADLDCEGDHERLAAAEDRLDAFPLRPSIVIGSGGGLHAYWLLREPLDVQAEQAAIYALLRRLVAALDGDPKSAEPARVLRLPGTRNQKSEYGAPRAVTIRAFAPERRYNPSEFDPVLPDVPPPSDGSRTSIDLSQPILVGGRNDAVYRYGRSLRLKGASSEAIAASMVTLNRDFCRPPLDDTELHQIICNVLKQPDRVEAVPDVELEITGSQRHTVMTRLTDIDPQMVEYVWPGRIARGRLNLLIGDPGLGKSFVVLDVAARVTTGRQWPDGGVAPMGDVLILSAEDHAADTIRPRADALGADVARIYILSGVRVGEVTDQDQPFSLVTDLPLLDAAIDRTGAILVDIDPVSAYLGTKLDSYKDAHVRSVFGPLAALAERRNVAIVGIMHLTKGTDRRALYRTLGSVAFVAAARLVFAVAPHRERADVRVLVPVKSNVCAPADSLAFRLTDGRLTWEVDPVLNVTADQLLSAQALGRHERQDAVEWLRAVLSDGPVSVAVLQAEAKAAGLAWMTVRRAKADLDVDSVRTGGLGADGHWSWFLQPPQSATVLQLVPKVSTPRDVSTLDTDPIKPHDSTALDAKALTFQTANTLASEAVNTLADDGSEPEPAFVTEDSGPLPEPDTSETMFADRDEDGDGDRL